MFFKVNFFRILSIPACLVWGVLELIALQRARLWNRRAGLFD